MSLPDLSFLLRDQAPDPGPEGEPLASPEPDSPPAYAEGTLPALIAGLRAYPAEVEAQN